ncbi:hypothetical protein GDO78_012966 [Eleutherodactylus coqui]|uniref:Uncharacterized protein n=1 Tax=Eleutherodactylus coqui TaxID=57060 RepID=A0A8J6EZ77_ELECQ|nr:hypothetical protein GDO78_012966 [Eleutherodactylus coqui]
MPLRTVMFCTQRAASFDVFTRLSASNLCQLLGGGRTLVAGHWGCLYETCPSPVLQICSVCSIQSVYCNQSACVISVYII